MDFLWHAFQALLFLGLAVIAMIILLFIKELIVECIYRALGKERTYEESTLEDSGTAYSGAMQRYRRKARMLSFFSSTYSASESHSQSMHPRDSKAGAARATGRSRYGINTNAPIDFEMTKGGRQF